MTHLMREWPQRPDGQPDLARIAAELSLQLHPIGSRLAACAGHLYHMRELLPKRGELVDEYNALIQHLLWIENAYRDADERLTEAAFIIDRHQREPNPAPLGDDA